jgi:hypothetical protein
MLATLAGVNMNSNENAGNCSLNPRGEWPQIILANRRLHGE